MYRVYLNYKDVYIFDEIDKLVNFLDKLIIQDKTKCNITVIEHNDIDDYDMPMFYYHGESDLKYYKKFLCSIQDKLLIAKFNKERKNKR